MTSRPPSGPGPVRGNCTSVEYLSEAAQTQLTITAPGVLKIGFLFDDVLVLPLDDRGGVPEELVERCVEKLRVQHGYSRDNFQAAIHNYRLNVRAVLSALLSASAGETT